MTAFAKVGLIAVIDEVTGYQDERDRNELQLILEKYVSQELLTSLDKGTQPFVVCDG